MKTKLTITHNGFHGYTSRSIVVDGNPGDRVQLSDAQIKKLERAGCPCADCKCGESLGIAMEYDGDPWDRNDQTPYFIRVPKSGTEIEVTGNYPQR